MNREIFNLFADNKPLPKNAMLRGEPISRIALESANKVPNHMSEHVPFWVLGWRDLHDDLTIRSEAVCYGGPWDGREVIDAGEYKAEKLDRQTGLIHVYERSARGFDYRGTQLFGSLSNNKLTGAGSSPRSV